jgi:hypothetical protein
MIQTPGDPGILTRFLARHVSAVDAGIKTESQRMEHAFMISPQLHPLNERKSGLFWRAVAREWHSLLMTSSLLWRQDNDHEIGTTQEEIDPDTQPER